MFTSPWQRPLILAAASLAFVTGTACAAQAAQSHTPVNTVSSVMTGSPAHCGIGGEGGEGGEGGKGGKGGQPGEPGEPGKPGRAGCFRFDDLPDKPKSELTMVDKVRIVVTLLADDSDETKEKIAKKYKISTEQIDSWKKSYENGDWLALMGSSSPFSPLST